MSSTEAAGKKRDELETLLEANYNKAKFNWQESDMRSWLISKGVLKSDAQTKTEQVTSLFTDNYNAAASKTFAYLSWSDNRMRAWLRDHGVEVPMSSTRQELVQTMRENYVSTQSGLGDLLGSIQDWIGGGVHIAEDKGRCRFGSPERRRWDWHGLW